MENFEAGVKCPLTQHKFVAGEQGMKCSNCQRVMKNSAWEIQKYCFCGSTNAVSATAQSVNRTRASNPVQSITSSRRQLVWRDAAPVGRPRGERRQLTWRDSRDNKHKIILISAISLVVLFVLFILFKK